jgi:hypothetical protein
MYVATSQHRASNGGFAMASEVVLKLGPRQGKVHQTDHDEQLGDLS